MNKLFGCLLAAGVLLAGCKKQLDQEPQSTASKSAVFGSEKGLALYSNSFYSVLPDANATHRGDEMSDYGARTSVADLLMVSGYGPVQGSGWDWGNLRNINYFIVNCTSPAVSADTRQNYIGIAR